MDERGGPFSGFDSLPKTNESSSFEEIRRSQKDYARLMQETHLLRDSLGHDATIWCFVRAADLPAELEAKYAEDKDFFKGAPDVPEWWTPREMSAVKVLIADRKCPQWVPHTEGLSPKDHWQEFRMLQMERDRADLMERLSQAERKSAEEHIEVSRQIALAAESNAKAVETLAVLEAKASTFVTIWTYIAVGLAVGALLIGLLSYLLPYTGSDLVRGILDPRPTSAPSAPPSPSRQSSSVAISSQPRT